MADIFHEIDEDLRRERFSRLWSRYGGYLIAFAVLIVVAVAGWRGYEWWQLKQSEASGARFETALQLALQGKNAEAEAIFVELEKDGTPGYRTLARFRSAVELAATDPAAAVAEYDTLARTASVGPLMQNLAQVRAAMLLLDTAPLAEIESRMKPLDTPQGMFRHSAREIIGLAQYKAGNDEAAVEIFTAILNDGESPAGLRSRAELVRTLAASPAHVATPVAAPSAEAPATPAEVSPEPAAAVEPAPAPVAAEPAASASEVAPKDEPTPEAGEAATTPSAP